MTPIDRALETAQAYADAGIEFVALPVVSPEDRAWLLGPATQQRLDTLHKRAEQEERKEA